MKINRRVGWAWAVASAVLATCGCGGRAVVPSSYKTYNADDGSFQIAYPAEWEVAGGGKGLAWAKFTSGSAQIAVETGLVGSLVGDITQARNDVLGLDRSKGDAAGEKEVDLAPARAAHEFEKQVFLEDTGVKEQDPVAVQTGLGDARKSEFTGSDTFGGAIHGYRATALSRDKRIRIVCQCPEAEWNILRPAFDKVIESIAMSKGAGRL
jgi:hypothetical protein